MKIRAERFVNDYDGHWEECEVEELYADDCILYVDNKPVEIGKFIKTLLERLGEVK